MSQETTGPDRSETAAPDPRSTQPSPSATLKSAAARLIKLLDRETTALRLRQSIDMDDLCNRKNQALLELSRIGRKLDGEPVDPELQPVLGELRGKLDENSAVLKLHLEAVSEVADILATAIRDAESDGTYGTHPGSA